MNACVRLVLSFPSYISAWHAMEVIKLKLNFRVTACYDKL